MTAAGHSHLADYLVKEAKKLRSFRYKPENLVRYCRLVSMAYELPKSRRHTKYPMCISLYCRWLDQEFGRGEFSSLNEKIGWLAIYREPGEKDYSYGTHSADGITRAYELTNRGLEQIKSISSTIDLSLNEKNPPRSNRRALRSRDSRNAPAKGRFELPNLIEIVSNVETSDHDSLLGRQLFMMRLQSVRRGRVRFLEQYYRQSPAGRWYAHDNAVSLQNCLSGVSKALLKGCFDYDIQSCHFALLRELTKSDVGRLPVIENMLGDRSEFRDFVESSAGLQKGTAKKLLNSLAYGAKLSANSFCELSQIFSADQIESIKGLSEIQHLRKELKTAKNCLVRQSIAESVNGRVTNLLGKSILKGKFNYEQRVAHLLQGAEAKVLSVVGSVYGKQMRLLSHDGWVLANYVSPSEIETLIEGRMGVSLKIDCAEL